MTDGPRQAILGPCSSSPPGSPPRSRYVQPAPRGDRRRASDHARRRAGARPRRRRRRSRRDRTRRRPRERQRRRQLGQPPPAACRPPHQDRQRDEVVRRRRRAPASGGGRLRLDDTVGARLPGVLPCADGVTLRQLLDHTSGVPDDVPAVLQRGLLRRSTAGLDAGSADRARRRRRAALSPGAGWAYSNTDYVLAALMIERASGHSLERELERPYRPAAASAPHRFPIRANGLGRQPDSPRLLARLDGPGGPVRPAAGHVSDIRPRLGGGRATAFRPCATSRGFTARY